MNLSPRFNLKGAIRIRTGQHRDPLRLDTDHLSLYQRGVEPLLSKLLSHPPDELAITIIKIEEQLRGRFRDALKLTELFSQVPSRVWGKDWVVHSEPVGSGQQAFQYLAPYIFRVALSNNRLRSLHEGQVTFSYKESATDQLKRCTLTAEEFIRRFLQHVLPPRFIKVRYYGLLSPAQRQLLQKARHLLSPTTSKLKPIVVTTTEPLALLTCPHCAGPLTWLSPLAPRGRAP